MEFIGLFGLIGLVGFFFGKGLEQKFDILKKEVRRESGESSKFETRIAENEKFISEMQRNIGQINSALQNFTTGNDLERLAGQLQTPLREMERKISAAVSKIDEVENKISDADLKIFQNKIGELQNADKKLDARLAAVEKSKISSSTVQTAPDNSAKLFEQKISALEMKISEQNKILLQYQNSAKLSEQKISALEMKISEQNKNLLQYQNYFSQVQNNFNTQVQNNFNNLQKQIDDLKRLIATTPPPPPPPPPIQAFQIKNSKKPLFTNNPSDAAKSISIIENLSEITSFLENSNFDKKESFIRLIKNYRQNLQKFIDKVKSGKFDEDVFSEEVTDAFFDILSKYFLATLPVSIYRGGRENPKFYSDFLAKVNSYLSSCHVYTELFEPKKFMNPDDVEKMSIVKKDTPIKSNDKIIDEVERLPYFLDYLTEDNENEHYCFEGKMVVFKFNGGKK